MAGKIGQPFVAITDGDWAVLRRLGRNGPRAMWLLTILRRQAGAKKLIEISDGRLAMLGKVSTSTVYHGVRDLIELNFIRKASGDRAGRRSVKNAYQILDSPMMRDEVEDRSSKIEDRFSQIEGQVLGSRGIVPRKSSDKRPKTEDPLILDKRGIDVLDTEKKNGKGFCLRGDNGNVDGMNQIDGISCLAKIRELLRVMGIVSQRDLDGYSEEIFGAGLTDGDVKRAFQIATYRVGLGEAGQLGGIRAQGGWTPGLGVESLKYGRGIINDHIKTGDPIELPPDVAGGMGHCQIKEVVVRGLIPNNRTCVDVKQ